MIPCHMVDRLFSYQAIRLVLLLVSISSLQHCAAVQDVLESALPLPGQLAETIESNDFWVTEEDDVIGRLAVVRLEKGDTLPDMARHFSLGINTLSAANPGMDIWVPEAGERLLLPLSFVLPDTRRNGIVINLAAMRLFQFKASGNRLAVSTYPVGVGTMERPTPMGRMQIARKKYRPTWHVPASIAEDHRKKGDPLPAKVPPGPLNPLGEYALYLSRPGYLVHGTNKPASIGLRATNGCIRLYPEDIKRLYDSTPVKTPVNIVNQPYLIGQRNGIVYLEAHRPFKESGSNALKRAYAQLKHIEKTSGYALDWEKVAEVVGRACGYPVPVLDARHENEKGFAETVRLKHPEKLYGKPEIPELQTDAWYVLAAVVPDRVDALRLAAIMNHQGPQIPARVLSTGGRHRVLAGPFNRPGAAEDAAKRLKIDLEIEGVLVEP